MTILPAIPPLAGRLAAGSHTLAVYNLFGLMAGSLLGDTQLLDRITRPKVFTTDSRFLKREYLERTHAFYTSTAGRPSSGPLHPHIRTFAPSCRMGALPTAFHTYNVVGGIVWTACSSLVVTSSEPAFVQKNFSVVVIAIVLISVMPAVVEYLRGRKKPAVPAEMPEA